MRVTDLEKFALEQVWRPYQTLMGHERRLEKLPVSLEETAELLKKPSEWRACVLNRIAAIGVTFPSYIVHPLADVVREYRQQMTREKARAALCQTEDQPQ